MKKYHVEYKPKAAKALRKLDRHIAGILYQWIEKNLEGCENPRLHGKALSENRKDEWRYRVGDYRILADIQDEKILILVLEVGHRRDIY